jgi:NADH-quinone oxidoreductase subunit C
MYGVEFSDLPDLRWILTDYGFKSYPVLKDFIFTGYEDVRYDTEAENVVYNPIDLLQDFLVFDSLSPCESKTTKVNTKE